MKIIPLADRVVIKTVEVEETTKGGLILTGSAKEKPQVAGRRRVHHRASGRHPGHRGVSVFPSSLDNQAFIKER